MTEKSVNELQAAVTEARDWIEAVTGRTLFGEFRESLEDGIILCELINQLKPGCIRKINLKNIAIAHLDNIKQFLTGCEGLGLKDSQLFDLTDLQAPGTLRMKSGGVKHTTADRRLRNVVITLFWLGRKVAQVPSYTGPQLNLEAFKELLDIPNQSYYLKGYEPNSNSPKPVRAKQIVQTNHSSHSPSHPSPPLKPTTVPVIPKPTVAAPVKPKPAPPLDETTDISADELLANIQSVVDELHLDYQSLTNGSPEVGKSSAIVSPTYSSPTNDTPSPSDANISFTTTVNAVNGSFGLQIIGGADSAVPAQIELLLAGGPAETSGLLPHDLIVSINGLDVSGHNHFDLINLIKQGPSKGAVTMGVVRRPSQDAPQEDPQPFQRAESQIIWEEEHTERERQRQEVAMLYKTRSEEETSPVGATTSVRDKEEEEEEEEEDNWEEMLDEQLQWQNANSSKPLDDLQHQLNALRILAERKPSPSNTAMSSIKPFQEEVEVKEEVKDESVKEEDDTTPLASDDEHEKESVRENVRGEGEGREADPVIQPHPEYNLPQPVNNIEEDPFAPLKKTSSTQSELLQEVLSAQTSITNGLSAHVQTSVTSFTPLVTSITPLATSITPLVTSVTPSVLTSDSARLQDRTSPRIHQFSTPNARVVSMDFEGETEELHGLKVKAVLKTRWTPEMKENRRVVPNRSAGLVVAPPPPPLMSSGYEKHEVVMTDVRGRSHSYGTPEEHKIKYTARPSSGQINQGKRPPNCTHCRGPITSGPMMSIPARKIHFHSKCLICVVCRSRLTLGRGHTTVFLRHSLPHCASCYSTDNGIKATTC